MAEFGKTLKELRKKAGLTQQQLAEKLWITKATVSYYEQSIRHPSPEMLIKIANTFHVSCDYLLGIEEKKQVIDVTDLTEEDFATISEMINLLRKKNNKIETLKNKKNNK